MLLLKLVQGEGLVSAWAGTARGPIGDWQVIIEAVASGVAASGHSGSARLAGCRGGGVDSLAV